MPRIQALIDLQTLDLQQARVATRLSQVEAALARHPALARAAEAAAASGAAALAARGDLAESQRQRASLKERLAREEARLYDGHASAPKELAGLHQEVAVLRRHLAELDDVALGQMLALDGLEATARADAAALAAAEANAHEHDAALAAERDKLRRASAILARDRERLVAGIDGENLAAYEALHQRHGGRVIVPAAEGHCGGCGMRLPSQLADRALSGQTAIVTCLHCGRILVP
jgi:predicted  nucleic acid-binding Zn-ribbon protein